MKTSDELKIGYWALHIPPPVSTSEAPIAGFCGFRQIGPEIELMYGLRREHWGKGLATEACAAANIIFVGPLPDTMRRLGNKVEARNLAEAAGVPVMPATPPLPPDATQVLAMARSVGFPVMLKASWGGGGRGMRMVEDDKELIETVAAARREAKARPPQSEGLFDADAYLVSPASKDQAEVGRA